MVKKCEFCGRLFDAPLALEVFETNNACPRCKQAAKNNDFPPGPLAPDTQPQKKFVEHDGFFDRGEFITESNLKIRGEGFFEASDFHPTK